MTESRDSQTLREELRTPRSAAVAGIIFAVILYKSLDTWAQRTIGPRLLHLEESGPP